MADASSTTQHQFIEGVGGRLSKTKSDTYAKAVLRAESRANEYIAKPMMIGDLAVVLTAMEMGITPKDDGKKLCKALVDLLPRAAEIGRTSQMGDIVVQREYWIVDMVGKDATYWLHIGRNRAESLRGSVPRLFFRDVLNRQYWAWVKLMRALVDKAEPVLDAVAPFYHHLQHAGRTTIGEYLLSFAFNLNFHFDRILQADERLDMAPPPNCGRPVVVDLIERWGHRMGFSRVAKLWQSVYITEEQFTEPFAVLTQMAIGLARLAEDLRLYMTAEFDYFELADEHASGSSGRPQKKNPFGLQAVLSGAAVAAARLSAHLSTNITISEEGDSTYHAGGLYQVADDIVAWTEFMTDVIEKGTFKVAEFEKKSTMGYAGAREALDMLVYEYKIPYRFAHHAMGATVRAAIQGKSHEELMAVVKGELPDYPDIDANELVRTMTGESKRNMFLNHKAYHAVHKELDESLRKRESTPLPNPVDATMEKLIAEAKRVMAE